MAEQEMTDEEMSQFVARIFLRGYSCAIGPIRSADPEEMDNAVRAAMTVLHTPAVNAALEWAVIAVDAQNFLRENADHIKEHHA